MPPAMSSVRIVSIMILMFEMLAFHFSINVSPANEKELITIANKSKVVVSCPNSSLKNLLTLILLFRNFILLSSFTMPANGLRLCEEADFGAQNCQHTTKVDAR